MPKPAKSIGILAVIFGTANKLLDFEGAERGMENEMF